MTLPSIRSILSREIILRKLEHIYWHAINARKWNVALQAVIMQGRQINMFVKQNLPVVARIKDMTEEQLDDFIAYLEEHDPDLKPPDEAQLEMLAEKEGKGNILQLERTHPPPPALPND